MGALIVSKDGRLLPVSTALNEPLLASKRMLSAVVARNEPSMSNTAESLNMMPLGLSKNRLASPLTPRVPSILEILSGSRVVTRLKIFLTAR